MSEDTTVVIEEGKDKVPAGEGDIEEMVQLTPATYSALLDRLDELEASPKSKQSVDTLADAGTQRSRASFNDEDIENMRPKDLINAVIGHIEDTRIQPLLVRIEEMNVKAEIRDLTRDGKNQDFFDLKDTIYEVASKNPQLSIEEALILARQKKGYSLDGKKPEVKGDGPSKTDLLRGLPPRKVIGGEKPNTNRGVTGESDPETRKDAALMALRDMKKAGKL